ncbi:histidine phosphatase family protein [Rufibacter roseus]|uniref:Histidine phosphatase family protein n=1 Tax=Rufibacter roseus TaxID=1567108 RepID=A0ABW2DQL0_9BACT|nr:histidine phosphatase family protein [Rufibacter roseus]
MANYIYLIRHAKPIIDKSGFFSKAQAQQYLKDYHLAEVEEILERDEHLPAGKVRKVLTSTLPRAKATAKMLFGNDVELVEDEMFREFENRIWGLPIGKFPLAWWQVTSRVLWMLGLNQKEIESFIQAKTRAAQAAHHLAQEAEKERIAVLVAHGFLNQFIKRSLRKQGWKVKRNGGRGYVGITILTK